MDGWTQEAAEAVCYPEGEAGAALDELGSLLEQVLVHRVQARLDRRDLATRGQLRRQPRRLDRSVLAHGDVACVRPDHDAAVAIRLRARVSVQEDRARGVEGDAAVTDRDDRDDRAVVCTDETAGSERDIAVERRR